MLMSANKNGNFVYCLYRQNTDHVEIHGNQTILSFQVFVQDNYEFRIGFYVGDCVISHLFLKYRRFI